MHRIATAILTVAIAAFIALLGMTVYTAAANATPAPAACVVKTWQGQPYAFCGSHHCVAIDNGTNTIRWASRTRHGATRYRDFDRIIPARPIPASVRPAYLAALAALTHGTPGQKVVTVCRD